MCTVINTQIVYHMFSVSLGSQIMVLCGMSFLKAIPIPCSHILQMPLPYYVALLLILQKKPMKD